MKRRDIILVAAACAVLIVARVTHVGAPTHLNVPALAPDKALVGHPQLTFAFVGWVIFNLYWEFATKNASAAKSAESSASRSVHVSLVNLAWLLVIVGIQGLGRFLPVSSPVMAAGLAVEAAGLFVAIWARRHLGRNWSGEITIKVDHQLIRSGPYKLLRHPIYSGILAMYAGTALVGGEWLGLIGLAMALFAYWRKIRLEEANMVTAFGADYDGYCGETWALVPWLY
jgi:protein-S-isoprenylcysteine O-methyltransferase Ste14